MGVEDLNFIGSLEKSFSFLHNLHKDLEDDKLGARESKIICIKWKQKRIELYRALSVLLQGKSQTCFYDLGKEAKEDWKYIESFKQLTLLAGYFGTFCPPEIQMFQKALRSETLVAFSETDWRIILSFPFQPAVQPSVHPLVHAQKFSVGLQTACLGLLIWHLTRATQWWMELAVEKELLRKERFWNSCCNDVWGGSPEREQLVSRNAGLLDSTVFSRGEARRASWQYAFLIPWVWRCWKWLYFGDGSCHAFTDVDLGLQLPTQHYCSNFPCRSLTVVAQMLSADPNL